MRLLTPLSQSQASLGSDHKHASGYTLQQQAAEQVVSLQKPCLVLLFQY